MSIESADNILHVKNSTMRISRVEVGQTLSVGNIEFENTTTLTSVTSNGNNTTPYTISSSNVTTGLVTTANVVVGGGLEVGGDLGSTLLNTLYPVGMVLAMVQNWGGFTGQTWVQFAQGRTLVGQDSSDTAFDAVTPTAYIGEKSHTLTKAEIPTHTHEYVDYHQGGGAGLEAGIWHQRYDVNTTRTTGDGSVDGLQGLAHNNVQPYEVVYYYKRTA